ncbi:hypothetical protein QOT17_012817 [Balamuthia mandrillaris]
MLQRAVAFVFHVVCFVLDAYYYKKTLDLFDGFRAKGWTQVHAGEFAFLTTLTHLFQTVFFALSILSDLHSWLSPHPPPPPQQRATLLSSVVDALFGVVFTYACIVGLFFWGIFLYDRELIFGAHLDGIYPPDLNLFQHGVTSLLMIAEALLVMHPNFVQKAELGRDLLLVTLAGFAYVFWTLFWVLVRGSSWPYPFQADMDVAGHVVFNAVAYGFVLCKFFFGRWLCGWRWKSSWEQQEQQEQRRAKKNE